MEWSGQKEFATSLKVPFDIEDAETFELPADEGVY